MILELVSASLLLVGQPPNVPPSLLIWGAVLVGIIWVSTFAIQVPQHRRLAVGFDSATHRGLVRWNWIRTIAWTVRSAIAVLVAIALMG